MIAAAPISIASHACEGLPMPASTMICVSSSFIKISIISLKTSPWFEPIGAARGIMQLAPALSIALAAFRSGNIYGIGTKPSFAKASQAFIVSALSGKRNLESVMISILTSSPHPSSRASWAIRTASLAFLAPLVFGKSVTPFGIKSSIFRSLLSFMRLRARVRICAPASFMAESMSSCEYLPEPRIKRL